MVITLHGPGGRAAVEDGRPVVDLEPVAAAVVVDGRARGLRHVQTDGALVVTAVSRVKVNGSPAFISRVLVLPPVAPPTLQRRSLEARSIATY